MKRGGRLDTAADMRLKMSERDADLILQINININMDKVLAV